MALPIVRPSFPDISEISEAFGALLKSGVVTNGGPCVAEFERQLTRVLGVPTLAFCNGQTALMTMLRAVGVQGREVICPSFTFPATPHAIRWAGGTPVFADIDPKTLTLDPHNIAHRVTRHTKAILAVDSYGICCDYESLFVVAKDHDLKLLFDSAPAFGSEINGGPTGKHGDAQMFSFHATKPFSTMEGGCLCSNNIDLMIRAGRIRNFGQGKDGDCTEIGLNGKMMEICALIGITSLRSFDPLLWQRKSNAVKLARALMDIPGVTVPGAPVGQSPVWLYRPVLIDEDKFGMSRDEAVLKLNRSGIQVRKYYSPPCHLMTCYNTKIVMLPVTEKISSQVISFPVYHDMLDEEIETIASTLRSLGRK